VASLTIGFKAYDAHELACHFVARHAGLYEKHGLQPQLLDTTFIADADLPPLTFHAACGAALFDWLRGVEVRVVFVAAQRPMFSLHARPERDDVSNLRGEVVAGFPPAAPPAVFLRALLRQRSVEPDGITTLPARDDVARIGLLRDGSASVALLSSAVAPRALTEIGFPELLFLGDALRLPTTGLAVSAATYASEAGLVAAMRSCYRDALALLHGDTGILAAALAERVEFDAAGRAALAERVRRCYTRDGRVALRAVEGAVGLVAAELGRPVGRPLQSLYELA
jgi:hypothetical protein